MSNELYIDAEALNMTAEIISVYTHKQKELINEYLSKITSLIPDWNDDETFSPLIVEINQLKKDIVAKMDSIEATYPSYFRMKAESISSRPTMGGTSTARAVPLKSVSERGSSSISIMTSKPIDVEILNKEMCTIDGVAPSHNYVRTSSNGRRIQDLDKVGTFISPHNGEVIKCKTIAWRSKKSVDESCSENICGADFYYSNGTYCGSYTGKNWQEIYEHNYSDTKKYR